MSKTTGFPVLYDLPELDAFSNELEPEIKKLHDQVSQVMQKNESHCNALKNEDEFLKCISKFVKAGKSETKSFNYAFQFWQQKTYECFTKQAYNEDQDFKICADQSKQLLGKIYQDYHDAFKI